MLYNSKCSATAFFCYNIILFFSIQVAGQFPPFPLFPPSTPDTPTIPGLSPPSPNTLPPIPVLPPPSPNTLPGIPGLTPPITNPLPPIPVLPPPSPNTLPGIPGLTPPITNPLPPIPGQLTPPSVPATCPKNRVTMKIVCANVLGIPVMPVSRAINPLGTPCCKFIDGLLDIEVAVCICRSITFNTSNPRTNIPVSLVLLLNYCKKELTHDFRCATS
ncbi:hypothetical protein ACET3Z_005322 [Daucus carota]